MRNDELGSYWMPIEKMHVLMYLKATYLGRYVQYVESLDSPHVPSSFEVKSREDLRLTENPEDN